MDVASLSVLLPFFIFSYPVSGQLVSSSISRAWEWPPSAFPSMGKSPQESRIQWDSQIPSILQPPDASNSNGQTFSSMNTYFPGSSSFLPIGISSPVSLESQPNSQPTVQRNIHVTYPTYNPSSASSEPEYHADTSLLPTSDFFANPNIYSKPFHPPSSDFLSSFSFSASVNQPSIKSGGEFHNKFPFLSESGILDQQSYLAGEFPLSKLPVIQSKPNNQPPLYSTLPSDTFPSSSPLVVPHSGLNEQIKLSPEEPSSSSVFPFPSDGNSALLSPEPSSLKPQSAVKIMQDLPFSPEPFTYIPIPLLSQPHSVGSGDYHLLKSSSFPDSSNLPSVPSPSPLPFETFPVYSSKLFSEPYDYSLELLLSTPTSGVPETLDHSLSFPEEKSDLSLLSPEVNEPITTPSTFENISQIMTSYNPELPPDSNYEPTLPSNSSGSLNVDNKQSESSSSFNPSASVSMQPSSSQTTSGFPDLFDQKPQPLPAETTVRKESADQLQVVVNGSSKWANNSAMAHCPANERYLKCGPSCPRTCQNFIQNLKCEKKECKPGCFCKRGLLRNKYGSCVSFRNCNPTICRRHEIFRSCGPSCESTCENYGSNLTCSTDECVRGCFCRNRLVRRSDGRCVRPDHCKTALSNVPKIVQAAKERKPTEETTVEMLPSEVAVITNKTSETDIADSPSSSIQNLSKSKLSNISEVQEAIENVFEPSTIPPTSEIDQTIDRDTAMSSVSESEASSQTENRSIADASEASRVQNKMGDKNHTQTATTSEDSAQSFQRKSSVLRIPPVANSSEVSQKTNESSLAPAVMGKASPITDKSKVWNFASSSDCICRTPQSEYHTIKDQEFSSKPDAEEEYSSSDDQGIPSDQSSPKMFLHSYHNMTDTHNESSLSNIPRNASEATNKSSFDTEEMSSMPAPEEESSAIPDVSEILLPSEVVPFYSGSKGSEETTNSSATSSSAVGSSESPNTSSGIGSDMFSEIIPSSSSSVSSTESSGTNSDSSGASFIKSSGTNSDVSGASSRGS